MATQTWNKNVTITDPPVAQALFSNTRWAWIWLISVCTLVIPG